MPNNTVTVNASFAYKTPAEYWAGRGTASDPYIIATDTDWTVLTTAYDYFNDYFKLGGDINVTAPVGDSSHPFNGVFDGNGKKLKLALSSNSGEFAPFAKASGTNTVIKNLNAEDLLFLSNKLWYSVNSPKNVKAHRIRRYNS